MGFTRERSDKGRYWSAALDKRRKINYINFTNKDFKENRNEENQDLEHP